MSWQEFEAQEPEFVSLGRGLLNSRIAYRGTIKKDGSRRVRPVRSFIGAGGRFIFFDQFSPKRSDLLRDGRNALHSAVSDEDESLIEFLITDSAELVSDPQMREAAEALTRTPVPDRYVLFELHVAMY